MTQISRTRHYSTLKLSQKFQRHGASRGLSATAELLVNKVTKLKITQQTTKLGLYKVTNNVAHTYYQKQHFAGCHAGEAISKQNNENLTNMTSMFTVRRLSSLLYQLSHRRDDSMSS